MQKSYSFRSRQLSDEAILRDEIAEMKDITASKEKIIKQAAEKLAKSGKYDDDLTVICSRLVKVWSEISKSYIAKVLPDTYKRPYIKKEEDVAADLFEEILFRFEDIHNELAKISADLIKKCRDDENVKKDLEQALAQSIHDFHEYPDAYLKDLKKQLSTIRQLENLIEFLKKQENDIDYIKELIDYREKLDPFMKLRLKMMFFENHFISLGKKIHYSDKWMSITNRDETAMKIVGELRCCPACGYDMSEWFVKAKIAYEKGQPIPEPKVPDRKCQECGKPVIIIKTRVKPHVS